MIKTAWIFPGQGSQAVGMAAALRDSAIAARRFEQAAQILGWSVEEVCQGEEDQLNHTLYTQPCLYVVESIWVERLREAGEPAWVAGHSLGEYVALYAAGVFDFETGLRLVKRRAELMDRAAGGSMAALMRFDREKLTQLLEETPEVVLANDNSEQQVVISGTPEAVEDLVQRLGAKRAVTLKVSGAFHSPLMSGAAHEFGEVLEPIAFADAKMPVLSNTHPIPVQAGEELKERLRRQMTGSVRWRETMLQLAELGMAEAIEVGPGQVLSGLLKRTCPDVTVKNVSEIPI